MTKIVTNAAPLIHLCWIGEINLLPNLYDEIWTSTYVYHSELLFPRELLDFRDINIKETEPSKNKLEYLLASFKGKINYGEITCAAIYSERDYNELLIADKKAEAYLINHGINVRNFLELSYIAILNGLFDEEKARAYLRKAVERCKPSKRVRDRFTEEGFDFLLEDL